ncbi:MAG: McrC family protein [Clostridia bacterium]|nr:McrC family protein [Clostridia bacterium]
MTEPITVREYGAFCEGLENGVQQGGYITLNHRTFNALEEFALETRQGDDEAQDVMSVFVKRGKRVIKVKNFVGLITLRNGVTIEILPKIWSQTEGSVSEKKAREILLQMLRVVYRLPFKNLQSGRVDVSRMNILEVFIRMFLDEVNRIAKRGLKRHYEAVEENLNCFKGKLLTAQQLRHNLVHRERSYVVFDEYVVNRSENRLLKSTLLYLNGCTRQARNKQDIRRLLYAFSEVEPSANYDADFSKFVPDRHTKDYTVALTWARIFLQKKSFTPYTGSKTAPALLFPMEKLFEGYVAALIHKQLCAQPYRVFTQHSKYHLFDQPKAFSLRPDVVICAASRDRVLVLDTKWKVLDESARYDGVATDDM